MPPEIKHFVVVMLENRSFDNMLGWLYAPDNRPARNIPEQSPPTFDGLVKSKYENRLPGRYPVYAKEGAQHFNVPDPDPNELFDRMNVQIFGTTDPARNQPATMTGFLADYTTAAGVTDPNQIMQSYSPEQVPVLSALAREFAVCDRWFGSVPCQTWPNRAFAHAGTSCGRVNNCDGNDDNCIPDPLYYDTPTIFNVLSKTGHTWTIYNDTFLPSLTRIQFVEHLWDVDESHFRGFDDFKEDARSGNLPEYSFIEPSFLLEPNDQHPAHNVTAGEKFLYDIWKAVSTGEHWHSTLLLITYDEHGGCYDHCPPPWGAIKPDRSPTQKPYRFNFDRYGPRVPAVLVSPYIEPGTVFRTQTDVEYDHTSILATLRDWLKIPQAQMLKSKRIFKAPVLFDILSRSEPRDTPNIPKPLPMGSGQEPSPRPLSALQRAVIDATVKWDKEHPGEELLNIPAEVLENMTTETDAVREIINILSKK